MAHSPQALTTYNISRGDAGSDFPVQIHVDPSISADNLPLTTWGSSYVLANALHNISIDRRAFTEGSIHILELGAGTGLVGLSASVIWKGNVVLTDLSGIVPGLAQNIKANTELLSAAGTTARCGSLDWTSPEHLELQDSSALPAYHGLYPEKDESGEHDIVEDHQPSNSNLKASIIVAADIIYDADHPEMFVNTVFTWLKPGQHSRVVVALPQRPAYDEARQEMRHRLEAGGLIAIQDGEADAGEEFEDERVICWDVFKWNE